MSDATNITVAEENPALQKFPGMFRFDTLILIIIIIFFIDMKVSWKKQQQQQQQKHIEMVIGLRKNHQYLVHEELGYRWLGGFVD